MINSEKILLCDESIETLKILDFLIEQKELGEVIEEVGDGNKALEIILSLNPDLVITEYSLLNLDGNEVIRKARNKGYKGKFIVVSNISDPEVISKAYENGASFYITKPINLIEIIHIIEQVLKTLKLEKITEKMKTLLNEEEIININDDISPLSELIKEVDRILMSLGLHGMTGYLELKEIILISIEMDKLGKKDYLLSELYQKIADKNNEKPKTIEQKIRRSAQRAMDYVAEKGLEDYDSIIFDRYAANLFDFAEIRQHMNYLSGKSKEKGILKLRKFVEGIKSLTAEISEE